MKIYLKFLYVDFHGPLPNKKGNLCIAGHNYKNSLMFSKLDNLDINDKIFIYDLNKNKCEYIVYNKYIIKEDDMDCIKNNGNIEITLVTCNINNNKKRVIVKAKMKET